MDLLVFLVHKFSFHHYTFCPVGLDAHQQRWQTDEIPILSFSSILRLQSFIKRYLLACFKHIVQYLVVKVLKLA